MLILRIAPYRPASLTYAQLPSRSLVLACGATQSKVHKCHTNPSCPRKTSTVIHQPQISQIYVIFGILGQNLNGIPVSRPPFFGERPYPRQFHPVEFTPFLTVFDPISHHNVHSAHYILCPHRIAYKPSHPLLPHHIQSPLTPVNPNTVSIYILYLPLYHQSYVFPAQVYIISMNPIANT